MLYGSGDIMRCGKDVDYIRTALVPECRAEPIQIAVICRIAFSRGFLILGIFPSGMSPKPAGRSFSSICFKSISVSVRGEVDQLHSLRLPGEGALGVTAAVDERAAAMRRAKWVLHMLPIACSTV
jgi:hypothetical protein